MLERPAVLLIALLATGCAREMVWARFDAPPPSRHHWPTTQFASPRANHPTPSYHGASAVHGAPSEAIPGGEACLAWLRNHGIAHRPLDPKPGMETPIEVHGPIGGVWFRTGQTTTTVCDCRLAVALHWVSPELRALGVTAVRHSGAYVFRNQRSGRASLHARGLAIDVHDVHIGDRWLSVEETYQKGLDDTCHPGASLINRVTCRLGRTGLFKELLTPDYNRDHHDHLHLAIAPL
jgi:hypothetical protein